MSVGRLDEAFLLLGNRIFAISFKSEQLGANLFTGTHFLAEVKVRFLLVIVTII